MAHRITGMHQNSKNEFFQIFSVPLVYKQKKIIKNVRQHYSRQSVSKFDKCTYSMYNKINFFVLFELALVLQRI